jgi:glucosamine kinase
MSKKNIFIGVDGGGTKSKVYIEDQGGKCLGTGVGGPSNIRLSVEQAWDSIDNAIRKALKNTGISLNDSNYAFHLGAALAGVEVPSDRERFLAHPHPFTTLSLDSDAYAACLGAHNNKDGAVIIIGTGVNGYEVQNGQRIQVSGWGFPHDDRGGGAWLSLQACSLTLQWLDGRTDATPMLEAIFKYFNNDQVKLVAWANAANSTQFAKLAPFVTDFEKKQDLHAMKLIKEAAQAIDQVAMAMEKRAIDKSILLPVALFGGIAPFIRPHLGDALKKRLIERAHDAPVGAVYMIRNIVEHKK